MDRRQPGFNAGVESKARRILPPRAAGNPVHVVFLLGAGVSRDLLPLSTKLTEMVWTARAPDGREVVRHTDASYSLAKDADAFEFGRPHVQRVASFLTWLKNRFPEENLDYEGLFFACKQIDDAVTGELENPLLEPFLDECGRQALVLNPGPLGHRPQLRELAAEALNYIGAIVRDALTPSAQSLVDPDQLKRAYRPLLEACGDAAVVRLDLVTLNHDTLLERSLETAGTPVEDGFGRPRPGFRVSGIQPAAVEFWRGFRQKRGRVRLIKLHGSIDWWRVRPVDSDWSEETVARVDVYPQRLHDATGTGWDALDVSPLILVGTFNKILDYTQPFHLQHYVVMRRALLMSDALVIAGYSFRDKAVNGLITDWYYARGSRPLIVIGPHFRTDKPPGTARGAIANKWVRWCASGRMTVAEARFSDTDWYAIKQGLVAHQS